jgi:beta-galactosidase
MLLGVDYYPEQWDSSMIDDDMNNILELGGNVIRIGEFSWHLMEKREGEYDFSFFDKVIAKAKEKNLKVIMGTPTATIPAWLAKKHPDIISEFEGGKKRTFGGRHVYCFNSPEMYEYSEKIIRELISHYKDEKQIIAWQVDNEIGHEGSDVCYCKNCQKAFQNFLKNKFNGDINKLNDIYGTTFWSQEYNDFDEIPTPMETITTHNPALRLDWERFRNKSIVDFMKFQYDLIKSIAPDAVVMHDFPGGGLAKHVDYSDVAKYIDVVAYNNYPVWGGQKVPILPHEIAFSLDYIRGLKGDNFWITEAIMGAQGHDVTGFLPRPDQAKMWSYQGMARGCNSMMYFRYRGATKGAEQFCYGVIDSDNRKRRKFREVQSFFNDIKNYSDQLDTKIKSDVAILYDYDSLAAFRIQRQSILLDTTAEMQKIYKQFYDENIMVDVIPASRDISGYKIVVVSNMIITDEAMTKKLEDFTANGGKLIVTYRTAIKNRDNNLILGEMTPIGLNELTGVTIEETESLQDYDAFELCGMGDAVGIKGVGGIFRDMLVVDDADILYSYNDKFYKDYAAITRKSYKNGTVYYIGCAPEEKILKNVVDFAIGETDIEKTCSPDGIEIVRRGNGENSVVFMINHNDYDVNFNDMVFAPFECKIIK